MDRLSSSVPNLRNLYVPPAGIVRGRCAERPCYTRGGTVGQWQFKGIQFEITTEPVGPFVLASARTPKEGAFVRVRPFSALGRNEEEAMELLRSQIRSEFRRVPDLAPVLPPESR